MAGILLDGHFAWELERDEEGYRTYKIKFRVKAELTDGPATVLQTPGLPLPGDPWVFDADNDPFVWCRPGMSIRPELEDEPNEMWTVECTYSNKPPDNKKDRCNDTQTEDPLLEPQKVSGGFTSEKEEAAYDRLGYRIVNSAQEMMRGSHVEFDVSRPNVKISQNVPLLQLALVAQMINTLNDRILWGLPPRAIRLTNFSWERKYHGKCYAYYTRSFEFDINFGAVPTGKGTPTNPTQVLGSKWDARLLDEGTKVVRGDWDRDPASAAFKKWVPEDDLDLELQSSYIRFQDWNGENTRVILDGNGLPYDPETGYFYLDSLDPPVVGAGNGTDYQVGDFLYIQGDGTFLREALIEVRKIAANGGILEWEIVDEGVYIVPHSSSVTTVLAPNSIPDDPEVGSGSGATFNALFVANTMPGQIKVEKYSESNFLLLGIPTVL